MSNSLALACQHQHFPFFHRALVSIQFFCEVLLIETKSTWITNQKYDPLDVAIGVLSMNRRCLPGKWEEAGRGTGCKVSEFIPKVFFKRPNSYVSSRIKSECRSETFANRFRLA
jgi:hypothetical protein